MRRRTFTDAGLQQLAAATASANPLTEAEQKAYAPATRLHTGIPAGHRRTVRISSPCPATGQTRTLTAGPDGVLLTIPDAFRYACADMRVALDG